MENVFLSKSELNLDAAEKLKNNPNNHHASSVHCSYYSCYQRLLHILYQILGYDLAQYDEEFRSFKLTQNGGNHEFMLQLFWQKISTKSIDDAKEFKTNFISLRKLRIDSDYRSLWLEKDSSEKAYNLALAIMRTVKKNF